jgi:hypothetical protein
MWDELWVEVKCQTNPEIACSPRNSFRASLTCLVAEVELLNRLGGVKPTKPNQTPNAVTLSVGVGLREMSFVVERETAQTAG